MSRRGGYYKSKSSNGLGKIFLLIACLIGGIYYSYTNFWVFNPQTILDNSILKEKNFATKVEEINSPRKGIKAYWFYDNSNPIISVDFVFKNAGLASDNENAIGVSNMVATLLLDGAGELNSQAFKEELENKAIGISFDVNMDDFTGSLVTTRENQARAFELLKLTLTQPRFESDDIQRLKDQTIMAFKRQREHPQNVLGLEFEKELYNNHPYARNPLGDKEAITKFDKLVLDGFVKQHLTQSNLIVGIAGDISKEEAEDLLDNVFGDLPQKGSINFVRNAEPVFDGRVKNINMDIAQTISSFANKGVSRNDKDFYPLFVANHIFGGSGLSSRLSMAAREKEGLTYSIYTYLSLADKSPLIQGGFSATKENYAKVKEIMAQELQKFGNDGVSKKELDDAKNYLISSYNLRFASISTISSMLVYMQKDDLGLDFLQKRNDYVRDVKLKDVNRVAKDYFGNKKAIYVNVGNFGKE